MNDYEIPLTNRLGDRVGTARVDRGDREIADRYAWRVGAGGYATCQRRIDGRAITYYLHREILGLRQHDPRHVDHINRDPLDNRRSNLRVVTNEQNAQNKRSKPGSSSRYRGVSFHQQCPERPWIARVKHNGKTTYLGAYASEVAAAKIAAQWRALHLPHSVEDPALLP